MQLEIPLRRIIKNERPQQYRLDFATSASARDWLSNIGAESESSLIRFHDSCYPDRCELIASLHGDSDFR